MCDKGRTFFAESLLSKKNVEMGFFWPLEASPCLAVRSCDVLLSFYPTCKKPLTINNLKMNDDDITKWKNEKKKKKKKKSRPEATGTNNKTKC